MNNRNRPSAVRVSQYFRLGLTCFRKPICITGHRSPLLRMATPITSVWRSAAWSIGDFGSFQPSFKRWRDGGGPKNNLAPASLYSVSQLCTSAIPSIHGHRAVGQPCSGNHDPEFQRELMTEKYLSRPEHPCRIVTRESKHGIVVAYESTTSEKERRAAHILRALLVKH